MSENVEIVHRLFAAFGQGLDAAADYWDPEIDWRAIEGAPDDVGTMHGRDALRHYYEQWYETFDGLRAEPDELTDAGDQVVAAVRVTGRLKESDAEVEMRLGIVYTLRDGKIVRGREYATHQEALEAAELSE